MARRERLLALLLATAAAASPLVASAEKPEEDGRGGQDGRRHGRGGGTNSPEFENVRRALEALTPEQRRRFQENFSRWSNLSPEEKRGLRDRDELRRKKIQQEVERAVESSGLKLEGERREQFARRYFEERRKVEEQLRKEMDEKRQPLIEEIVGRLKEEFGNNVSPAAAAVQPAETTQPQPAAVPATPAAQ